MDNSGRPNETYMIDGEPYSRDDLMYMIRENIEEWDIWYQNLSPMGKWTVNQMLKGEDARAG